MVVVLCGFMNFKNSYAQVPGLQVAYLVRGRDDEARV